MRWTLLLSLIAVVGCADEDPCTGGGVELRFVNRSMQADVLAMVTAGDCTEEVEVLFTDDKPGAPEFRELPVATGDTIRIAVRTADDASTGERACKVGALEGDEPQLVAEISLAGPGRLGVSCGTTDGWE